MKNIGIPGWVIDRKTFGLPLSYTEFIMKFGRPVILNPADADNPPDVDMLVCPGGLDILPASYGVIPSLRTQNSNQILEHFDANILPQYLDRETPILGICRGAQRLWTMFGGELTQHDPFHEQSGSQKHEAHRLSFTEEYKYLSKFVNRVTSRHHQMMNSVNFVPDELEVIAHSAIEIKENKFRPEEDVVEIFTHSTRNIYGVQFHPEDNTTDRLSSMLVNCLLEGRKITREDVKAKTKKN